MTERQILDALDDIRRNAEKAVEMTLNGQASPDDKKFMSRLEAICRPAAQLTEQFGLML